MDFCSWFGNRALALSPSPADFRLEAGEDGASPPATGEGVANVEGEVAVVT